MPKMRPNAPCPCGSGRKYKKCCNAPPSLAMGLPHTRADRQAVLDKIACCVEWSPAWSTAWENGLAWYWPRPAGRSRSEYRELDRLWRDAERHWLAFDYRRSDGVSAADVLLTAPGFSAGERAALRAMRAAKLHVWEVMEAVPGATMRLREVIDDTVVTVHRPDLTSAIRAGVCVAARVVEGGASGRPELEGELVLVPDGTRENRVRALREARELFLSMTPGAGPERFYETLPPLLHALMLGVWRDDRRPTFTRIEFEVLDEAWLRLSLDDAANEASLELDEDEFLEAEGEDAWAWWAVDDSLDPVDLGRFELCGNRLVVETDSDGLAERARDLLERLAGPSVRYRPIDGPVTAA